MSAASIVARVKAVPSNATAATIAEIVDVLKADLAAAIAETGRLTASRPAVLMSGDDAALVALDAAITAGGYRQERATLLLAEMDGRLGRRKGQEASWAEAARLDAMHVEAAALSAELQAGYEAGYVEPARKLAAFLTKWKVGHARLKEINGKLHAAARHEDRVKTPEEVLRAAPWYDVSLVQKPRVAYLLDGRELGPDDMTVDEYGRPIPKDHRALQSQIMEGTQPNHAPGQAMPSLARHVALPAVRWGETELWKPAL